MKEVHLTQGYVAIVDDEDYERVMKYKWYAHVFKYDDGTKGNVYAGTNIPRGDGCFSTAKLHRFIMQAPKGMCVDHIDGNGLNNMKVNLRVCSFAENSHNMHRVRGKSKYKGVCWSKLHSKWRAQIHSGKKMHIGLFHSELDAARAYDAAAFKHFGEFARTNTYDTDE